MRRAPHPTVLGLGGALLALSLDGCAPESASPEPTEQPGQQRPSVLAPSLTKAAATPMAEALPLFASLAEAIEAPYRGDWDAWPRDPESGEWLRSTVELRVEGDPKVARFQLPISGVDDHLLRVAWRDPSWSLRRTNPSKEEAGLDDPFGEQVSEGLGPESGLAPVLEQGPHAEVHGATVIAHVTAAGFTLNQADPGAPLAEAPGVVFTFAEGATWGGFHAALCELNGHGLELAAIISSVPSRAVFVD